jgi:putative ABC transport system permease protein
MTALRVWMMRLVGTVTGRRREDDLRDELDAHLELLADEHRRRGLSDAEARLAARRDLGGVAQTREAFRDTRRLPGVDALLQDLRFAVRALRRERGTTMAALALLTVGVSSTVVLADVLDRLLLRPPTHVDDPSRVRRIYIARETEPIAALGSNYVTMIRLAEPLTSELEAVASFQSERIGSGHGPGASRLQAIAFTEAYFDVLGVPASLGTLPSARRPSDPEAVVISHALWQSRFGGGADVLGKPLRLGQRSHTVTAVLPRGFAGIDSEPVDVWVPLESRRTDKGWRTEQSYMGLYLLARLRPGVDPDRAAAHATQVYNLVQRIGRPAGLDKDAALFFGPLPLAQAPGDNEHTRVVVAVGVVSALVLLMACGNVANLLILCGLRRTSELTLKAALGAGRGRLLREVLIQAALLSALAGTAALGIVITIGVVVRNAFLPPLAALQEPLDGRIVGLTIAICAAVALLLGIAPALRLSNLRILMPGRNRPGRVPSPLLDTFVAIQVALSVPLLVGTVLFAVSYRSVTGIDIGFQPSGVVAVRANLADDGRPADAHEVHRRIQARIASLPGVASTALSQTMPLQGGFGTIFEIPGQPPPPQGLGMPMINGVDPSFLAVMGMRIIQGRAFTEADNRPKAPPVAIVNETMARVYWPGISPIGRCIKVAGHECVEVVGVVAKAHPFASLRGDASTMNTQFLLPMEALAGFNRDRVLLVRTSADPSGMVSRLRTEAQAAGKDLPYVDATLLDEPLRAQVRPLRLGWAIFLGLSAIALVIAIAGLAVVTAHGVTRRTREMGIRLVLGARPAELVRLMARRTLVAMTVGLTVGAALAYVGAGLLKSLLFGIEPGDPRVFAGAIALLFAIGGLAAWIPARRTGRIDPSAALRVE